MLNSGDGTAADNPQPGRSEPSAERMLLEAQELAAMGVWTYDVVENSTWWSQGVYDLLGLDPAVFTPTVEQFYELMEPDSRPDIEGYVVALLAGEKVEPVEYSIRDGSGIVRRLRASARAVFGEEGSAGGLIGTVQDVTELHLAQRGLLEREAELRSAIFASDTGLWVWDIATGKVRYSKVWKAQLGYAPEEISDDFSEWESRVHPDDLPAVMANIQRHLSEPELDEPYEAQFRMRHRDGRWVDILTRARLERALDGTPLLMRGGHLDVTRREAAIRALAASEERLRLSTELGRVAVWEFDARTGTMTRSANHDALYGLPPQEEWSLETFVAATHPTDAARGAALIAASLQPGGPDRYLFDFRLRRAGGESPRWLSVVGEVVERDDTGAGMLVRGCLTDISERWRLKRGQRTLAAAFEQAGESMLLTDAQGVIQHVNRAFLADTGFEVAEVLGQTPRLLKSGLNHGTMYKELWATISAGAIWRGKLVNRRKDGTLYTTESTIFPLSGEGGEVGEGSEITGYLGIQRDVTDRDALQEQFLNAQKMEAVASLAAGLAHDFNNTLSLIRGTTDLIGLEIPKEHPSRADLEVILGASDRAALLVRRLLTFSRHDASDTTTIDLGTSVDDAWPLLRRLIGDGYHLLVERCPEPVPVVADPIRIEQVLFNLIVNAKDAMPDGGTITLTCDRIDGPRPGLPAGAWARLSVGDVGIGMTEAVRSRCFEPFFSTKEVGKGTGLGLPTVARIVADAGGHVAVESAPGVGTTVTVVLPLSGQASAPTLAEGPPDQSNGTRHHTILVVDDDEALLGTATRMLQKLGYDVRSAMDGPTAIRELEVAGNAVDLVLSDFHMPAMNGHELAQAIGSRFPNIRVLMMSSDFPDESHEMVAPIVVPTFLHKPFGIRELSRAVSSGLLDAMPRAEGTGK